MFSRRTRPHQQTVNKQKQRFFGYFSQRGLSFVFLIGGLLSLVCVSSQVLAGDTHDPLPDVHQPPHSEQIPLTVNSTVNPGENPQNQEAAETVKVYLPMVIVSSANTCGMNDEEQAVFDLAAAHSNQGRPTVTCNTTLAQVARAKAQDMAERSYFGHVDPDGYGPNYHVTVAGYALPGYYSNANESNNIESIAAGYATAVSAWNGWLASPGHRTHVLAESSFWQDQTNIGIGYYHDPSSPYNHYWVFVSAPPEN
jgi:uncharacterized protein YkwD